MAGLSVALVCSQVAAQTFSGDMITISSGTATLGMDPADFAAPPPFDAPFHEASLSAFQMSACEVTNEQYVEFLNGALAAGLVEAIQVTQPGPDQGQTLVYGTSSAPAVYQGQALLNLSGTRVMKDHDNGDGDGDSFTGVIEPENPLNICYIGYDQARPAGEQFYVKDPTDPADFDWAALTNYHNYTSETHVEDTSETLNDYAAWPELANFPANMPSVTDVAQWPASFIRWYGAKAFALYYGLDLPTEAQWEYAAQGGSGFAYATSDGTIHGDGSSGVWNHTSANPALGHVQNVKTGEPNPYGLYNMGGNVWEWMEDWYAADFYQDATDVVNTTDTGVKVRRGGSWNYHQYTLRSASRARDEQFKGNDHFGFRVAGAVTTSPAAATVTYPAGWNLMSLPVTPTDSDFKALFPDALSAFGFAGGYALATSLTPCVGYWLNLTNGGTYELSGEPVASCDISAPASWSLQGVPLSGTKPDDIVQNPAGNILSLFVFDGGYASRSGENLLAQGQGYWLNLSTSGQLTLPSNPGGVPRAVPAVPGTFGGQLLWAQSGGQRVQIQLGVAADQVLALPPLPPVGALDMRVEVDGVETQQVPSGAGPADYRLTVQGTEVSLMWDAPAAESNRWELLVGNERVPLNGSGSIDLGTLHRPANLMLRQAAALPQALSLHPNHPNPFNPSTSIGYDLGEGSLVSLRIYDMAGQLVRSLVSGQQEPGAYSIAWDGRDQTGAEVASGVYAYELRAGSKRLVRKMLLMR